MQVSLQVWLLFLVRINFYESVNLIRYLESVKIMLRENRFLVVDISHSTAKFVQMSELRAHYEDTFVKSVTEFLYAATILLVF